MVTMLHFLLSNVHDLMNNVHDDELHFWNNDFTSYFHRYFIFNYVKV